MKTTLDLDDELLVRAKALAAREGRSLTALIEDGLRLRLRLRRAGAGRVSEPAIAFIDSLLAIPSVEMAELGREWPAFCRPLRENSVSGNDVPDAWIAAAVQTLGENLATFDRGFGRLLGRNELTLLRPA